MARSRRCKDPVGQLADAPAFLELRQEDEIRAPKGLRMPQPQPCSLVVRAS